MIFEYRVSSALGLKEGKKCVRRKEDTPENMGVGFSEKLTPPLSLIIVMYRICVVLKLIISKGC